MSLSKRKLTSVRNGEQRPTAARSAAEPEPVDPRLGGAFWRLFGSSAASNLADGVSRAVVPLLAASLTRDPLLISAVTSLSFLPWLLFALPAGTLVDRSDRRRVMVRSNLFRAVLFALLASMVATGTASIWLLYVVVFTLGVAETLYDSAARAVLPQIVRRDQLDRGNGLLVTAETGMQAFVGAPVGALIFGLAAAAPLLGNMAFYAVAALMMMTVAGRFTPDRTGAPAAGFRAELAAGVRWLWGNRFLRQFAAINGATSALQSMPNAVLVLYVLEVVGVSETYFGLMMLGAGVGGLLGGLVAPAVSRRLGRVLTLSLTAVLFPLPLIGMSLTDNAILGGTLYGLGAFFVMIGNVLSMSLRQALIPEELFGRVQGSYRTLVWGGIPIGALAGGVLAATTNVPAVFAVSGVGCLVVGVWMAWLLRRHRAELAAAFAPPPTEPALAGTDA
ncbi:MFS transporter [Salinispora oceanensis]|uniref:MFS transporter n=1 Tax=Salinispora oceanensis TaxID=1050199 RepID=UPI001CC69BBE|nr:MFS transporter [Salinispora oceanensis]